jgi:lysozyme
MQASSQCYEFVKKCEGYYSHAYDDGGGVWTIGWGTIRWDLKTPVKHGDTITVEEAQRQLEIEIHRVEDAINSAVKVPLTQAEFDALCSLFYNIGTGWCTGQGHAQATLIKLLNQGKYDAIPTQFLRFERDIHGRVVEGLAKRRRWESQLWLSDGDHSHIIAATPQNDPVVTPMPQTVLPTRAEPVVDTLKQSPSAKWSILGIFAGAGTFADSLFGWTKDTAQQVLDTANDTTGIQTLIAKFAHNAEQIGIAFTVAALAVVLGRKLIAAAQGRSF